MIGEEAGSAASLFVSMRVTETESVLRLLTTHVGFFRQNGLILSEVFCTSKGARILKKKYHNRVKKSPS